ncbi:MAG: YjcQ family protein [Clostridium botulinum]|nr:YjcQ family protein [Clostridium botulinum]
MDKQKLRYAILREIDKNNMPLTEVEFGVIKEEFDNAIRFLDCEEYLSGIDYADGRPWINKLDSELTEKGEKYLKDNSALAKAYKGLKEIKDWLK